MADRPILFSGDMVRAILDGRKTQTRRVIRPQPILFQGEYAIWTWPCDGLESKASWANRIVNPECMERFCPYGKVGDRLWVKETRWRNGGYVATDTPNINYEGKIPSIFMKKTYARIWLEIIGIGVERLQDISEEDCDKEGCSWHKGSDSLNPSFVKRLFSVVSCLKHRIWFENLWDSINPKHSYSWKSNPWVWVIEFRKVK